MLVWYFGLLHAMEVQTRACALSTKRSLRKALPLRHERGVAVFGFFGVARQSGGAIVGKRSEPYSYLSATIGLTFDARRAGKYPASKVMARIVKVPPAIVSGS